MQAPLMNKQPRDQVKSTKDLSDAGVNRSQQRDPVATLSGFERVTSAFIRFLYFIVKKHILLSAVAGKTDCISLQDNQH